MISKETLEHWKKLCDEAGGENIIPGYTVLRDGRIFSHAHDWRGYGSREMKQHPNSRGYLRVRLTFNQKRKTYMVHKLVCLAHIGKKPGEDYEVCHKNGVKTDNRASNLYWGTRKDNAADRTKHGNCKAAENGKKSAYKLIKHKCLNGHILNSENRYKNGTCRPCRLEKYIKFGR